MFLRRGLVRWRLVPGVVVVAGRGLRSSTARSSAGRAGCARRTARNIMHGVFVVVLPNPNPRTSNAGTTSKGKIFIFLRGRRCSTRRAASPDQLVALLGNALLHAQHLPGLLVRNLLQIVRPLHRLWHSQHRQHPRISVLRKPVEARARLQRRFVGHFERGRVAEADEHGGDAFVGAVPLSVQRVQVRDLAPAEGEGHVQAVCDCFRHLQKVKAVQCEVNPELGGFLRQWLRHRVVAQPAEDFVELRDGKEGHRGISPTTRGPHPLAVPPV
mmetsp:Transcript_26111/g.65818  ORF Transcript_26111/g.65818 Transcript_26111/m.65818 type:complete len:271 (-) Transcript_26111:48-860(-)